MTEGVSEKINLVYRPAGKEDDEELPFRILVLSDLNPSADIDPYDSLSHIQLSSADLSPAFASFQPGLSIQVENRLVEQGDPLVLTLVFTQMNDFEPGRLMHQIPGFADLVALREQLSICLDQTEYRLPETVNDALTALGLDAEAIGHSSAALAASMAELDSRLNQQLNAVLHHESFQQLEATWRSLAFLVQSVEFQENILVDVVSLSKDGLLESFEDAADITQSPLYQLVYSNEFGQFGGRPYSVLVGDYLFDPNAQDIQLLQQIARVSAIAHAPFLSAVSARYFGLETFRDFSRMRDLDAHFEQPRFDKWQGFRQHPDARYVALTLPRFLLRGNHGEDSSLGFHFYESYRKEDHQGLWGNSAYALVERFARAFARYRWYVNSVGEDFGVLPALTVASGRGAQRGQIPTEVLISDRRENDLVRQGFVPLTLRKGKAEAGFYSAASTHYREPGGSNADLLAAQLDGQLPYILIACRFAHYLKVMQREHIGSWQTRSQIDQELNQWLRQYVSDMDNPAPGVRARRPLRSASLTIRDVEGKAGWYMISMALTPHFKFLGQPVTLRESGRLDKY
ncbi:MAG: type VI secretion system contractile sheath large subunit [Saccharospirillum sp.]